MSKCQAPIFSIVFPWDLGSPEIDQTSADHCRELDLSGNAISELGKGLSTMPSLQILLLDHNRLEALPDSLAACPALLKLDVSHNSLTSLPPSLGSMRTIQRMNASSNFLTALPHIFGGLALKEFDLR